MAKGSLVCALIDMASEMVMNGNSDHRAFKDRVMAEYGINMDEGSAKEAMDRARKNVVDGVSAEERALLDKKKALADYGESLRKTSGREFLQSLIKAGLLSGVSSFQASLFGNAVSLASEFATRPIAALVDHEAAKKTGQRSVSVAGLSKMSTVVSKTAAKRAVETLLHGAPSSELEKFDVRRTNYAPFKDDGAGRYANHVTRGISLAINKVFDVIDAADKPARLAALVSGLHESAVLRAMNEGLKTKPEIEARVNELLGHSPDPSVLLGWVADQADKYPPVREVLTDARIYEDEVVFANASPATQFAQKLSDPNLAGGWIGTLALPFPKIPTNVSVRALEHTPLGILYGGGKIRKAIQLAKEGDMALSRREQRKGAMAIARGVSGSGLLYIGYLAAKAGMITTPTPQDQGEREIFYASGRQGSSVKVGNRWLSMRDYPQLFALFAGAQIARSESMASVSGRKFGAGSATAAGSLAALGQIGDMPTMQGFQSVMDSYQDLQRGLEDDESVADIVYTSSVARNLASMLVPKAVRDIGQIAGDPYMRSAGTPGEQVGADWPLTRRQAPIRYDSLGRPVELGPGRFIRGLSADQGRRLSDPVAQELYEKGARSRMPSRGSTRQIEPGEKAYQERVQESGASLRRALEKVPGSEGYGNKTPEQQRDELNERAKKARTQATKQFKARHRKVE